MKMIKRTGLSLIICSAVLSVQAAPVIEKPAVMPEAMLSLAAPDVHGLLDGVGSVAAKASPMMNGMMLKNMLGMQLGDPGLTGFAQGKGLAVVALNTTNIFAVLEISEAQSAAYTKMATSQGMQASYTNGVLVLGDSPETVSKGIAQAGAVKSSLLSKRSPTLRIAAQPNAVIERNNEQIQGLLTMMPALMTAQAAQASPEEAKAMKTAAKILEGELRVLLSIIGQCEAGELVIAPENGSVRLNETYIPKAGTRLATLMNSTKTVKANPKIQSDLLGDGMVQLDFVMGSPEAITDFIVAETENLVTEMAVTNIDLVGFATVMGKWMDLYGGTACETFGFDADDGLSVNYLLELSDEEAAMKAFRSMKEDMAPFLNIYKNMGMELDVEFKENVAEYKGIKIHRFEMEFDMDEMGAEQQKQMEALDLDDMDYDVAIFDGLLLYTMGENSLQKAIDRIKDPATTITPIAARKVYPEGAFYYCDIDIGRYLELVSAFMPDDVQDPIPPQVMAMMQGADPITSAGFRDDGAVMWSVNIPGDLIGKIGQVGMMMQMQKMQQQQMQQGMPGGVPQAAPSAVPVQ